MLRGTERIAALTCCAALAALAPRAEAVLIFDNFDAFANTGTFVGQDDWQGGDRMIVSSAGAGNMWVLNSFTGHLGATTGGTYTNVMATLTLYRTIVLAGAGPAFADPFGSVTQNVGGFVAGGPGSGVDFTLSGLGIVMHSPPTQPSVGYGVKIAFSATGPGMVVPHYRNQASVVPGSFSSQGWYRDLNDDGTIGADEYEVFAPWADGNLMFELDATATPIPEPATAVALLFPLGAMIASRRKRRPKNGHS